MVEINGGIAATPPPTAYPTPTVAPNHHAQASDHVGHSQLAVSATDAGSGRSDGKKSDAKKPDHANDIVISFNPSTRIDPDTHIVVLTIRDEAGKTVRQIPNEHELAAYKSDVSQHKK